MGLVAVPLKIVRILKLQSKSYMDKDGRIFIKAEFMAGYMAEYV